jgi:hypothetical protein
VENAFGLLGSVFRIFRKPTEIKVESTVVDIVLTCVYLYNFLRSQPDSIIHPKHDFIMRMQALAKLLVDLGEK